MHHIPDQMAGEHDRLLRTEVPLARLRRAITAARRAERAEKRARRAREQADRYAVESAGSTAR